MASATLKGKCLCGAVSFTIENRDLDHPSACHCSQCRRWSGHYWASVNAPLDAVKFIKGDDLVTWYRASDYARRGFCSICGSSLFWNADGLDKHKDQMAVSLGALDAPTGLGLEEHIFVADKGDYYAIGDGLPQKDKY